MPREVLKAADRRLPADPGRAAVLKDAVRSAGALRPADVWPHLNLIGCWTGGTLGHYLPLLAEWYGVARVRDIGLIASEGRTTIPVEDHTSAGLLDVRAAFFEFVPEADADRPDPPVLLADELTPGENYYVLMTTPGGLWRYDISDLVRCEGYAPPGGLPPPTETGRRSGHAAAELPVEGPPVQQRDGGRSSANIRPPPPWAGPWRRRGVGCPAYALAPVFRNGSPRYELFVEAAEAPPESVAESVDRRLRAVNCEYASKRGSGRLGPVAVRSLAPGSWAAWDARRLAAIGGVAEQYKRPVLIGDLAFADEIDPGRRRARAG